MQPDLFFSIVIPTYNRAHLIEKTIHTVLEQSYNNFELLIIDDGSTDNTKEIVTTIIEKNPQQKINYYYKQNAERGAARNYGTRLCKGQYITFLDSDDLFYKDHLENAAKTLFNFNQPELLHIRFEFKNLDGTGIQHIPVIKSSINKIIISGNFMGCHSVFLKESVAKNNLFVEDRNLAGFEDWELWLRLAAAYEFHYSNTVSSCLVNHDNRSVLITNKDLLIKRLNALLHYVLSNKTVTNYYRSDISKFKCSCYSYVSLHLALTKRYRGATLKFLFKSLITRPDFIFKKRFFAILKHLI